MVLKYLILCLCIYKEFCYMYMEFKLVGRKFLKICKEEVFVFNIYFGVIVNVEIVLQGEFYLFLIV